MAYSSGKEDIMKRKTWYVLIILVAMLLSACGQQTASPASVTPTDVTTAEEDNETGAPTDEQEVEQPATVSVESEASLPAECRPFSLLDSILPPPDPNLAPLDEADHIHGPDDASMTILEYSEFQ